VRTESLARHAGFDYDGCPTDSHRGSGGQLKPEFYLILHDDDLSDELANTVFEAGFDDSSLEMRHNRAAILVNDREGELVQVVRDALGQARQGDLRVSHVEMGCEVLN
jgi:hypothetical protein